MPPTPKTYKVRYKMEMAPGDNYGVRDDDIPKGMENVGKQKEWLKSSPEGLAVFASLKTFGFTISDVGDTPVYKQTQKGETVYWVPYAKYWNVGNVHFVERYIPLTVTVAVPTAEDLAAELEQHRADQAAELERHRDEQAAALDKMKADLELQKAKLAGEMELNKLRKEMADLQNGGTTGMPGMPGMPPGMPAGVRTFEIFGMLNNQKVPLAQVAANQGGRYVQVAGSRVLIGDMPGDGFGLAGTPGAWPTLYPGQSPANYGLDADKAVLGYDGTRGWVLSAQFLSQVFGSNWRSQIYG